MDAVRKHQWRCMGGGGGWEVWECERCGVTAIPNLFHGLWPDVLARIHRRWWCRP
jgi:hypothetical protein